MPSNACIFDGLETVAKIVIKPFLSPFPIVMDDWERRQEWFSSVSAIFNFVVYSGFIIKISFIQYKQRALFSYINT